MNKTCGPTAISRPAWQAAVYVITWLLVLLLISGCTSTRPLAKIGLVAPFEGLYRQSGYDALAAMRLAIADCARPNLDVMPLALDNGNDPVQSRIAAGKLLADPTVIGIIGPTNVAGIVSTTDLMSASNMPWTVPWLRLPQAGYADPATLLEWLPPLLEAAPISTTTRLVVGGFPASFAPLIQTGTVQINSSPTSVTLLSEVEPNSLSASDTVLWLGDAHTAAVRFADPDKDVPSLHLVMAVPIGSDVFRAHTKREIRQQTDWLVWLDARYNQWMQNHAPYTPAAYLMYEATCTMLAENLLDAPPEHAKTPDSPWRIRRYRINGDGEWIAVNNQRPSHLPVK